MAGNREDPSLRGGYDPRAKAASPKTYQNLKSGPATPSTPNQTQDTNQSPRISTCWKSSLGRSHIYERMYPDKKTVTLRIDGPEDSFIAMDNQGTIKLVCGIRDPNRGAGSGKLCIQSYGQQQQHLERTDIEYNAGTDGEGQALNIIAYGDVIESATGGERHIYAQKIMISATEELVLSGNKVVIQAANGSGSIEMFATNIEQTTVNKKNVIVGQKMNFGVSEETTVQFDPRASVNWVSPGHVNWKILGDYQQWIGGGEQHIVAGGTPVPPLIKDRSETYQVSTSFGGMRFTAATEDITFAATAGGLYGYSVSGIDLATTGDILISSSTGSIDILAGTDINVSATVGVDISAVADINITATANVNVKGALILLN